jgi:hypothetical protein
MGIAQKITNCRLPIFAIRMSWQQQLLPSHDHSVADLASCCKIFLTVDYWLIFDKSKASQGTIENDNSRYLFCHFQQYMV